MRPMPGMLPSQSLAAGVLSVDTPASIRPSNDDLALRTVHTSWLRASLVPRTPLASSTRPDAAPAVSGACGPSKSAAIPNSAFRVAGSEICPLASASASSLDSEFPDAIEIDAGDSGACRAELLTGGRTTAATGPGVPPLLDAATAARTGVWMLTAGTARLCDDDR